MSSRLVRAGGRVCAVVITTPDVPGLEGGFRFKVLGDQIGAVSGRFGFMGETTGRPPLLEEATEPRRRGARARARPILDGA